MKITKKDIFQLLRFMVCNQSAFLADLAVFTLVYEVFGLYYILSKAISYAVGACVSYLLNRRFTFKAKEPIFSIRLLKFLAVNCVSIALSLLSMYVFRDVLGLHVWLAYFGSILFSFSTNFTGNRFWVFRDIAKQGGR